MASSIIHTRPTICLYSLLRSSRPPPQQSRGIRTASEARSRSSAPPPWRPTRLPKFDPVYPPKRIKTYPPPPSARRLHPFPIAAVTTSHLATLDPTSSRQRLFDRNNPDVPRQGDILLATFKTGDPFAGICLSIRRRGVDTGILLRNKIGTVSAEMWVKVFSPNVKGVEVVKRAEKRARRARLYYLRKPEHDRGSVEGVVEEYLKTRRLVRSGAVGVREPGASSKRPGSGKVGVRAK